MFGFTGEGGADELHARVDHDDGSGRFHQLERHASRRVENHHLDNRTQECGRAQGNHGYFFFLVARVLKQSVMCVCVCVCVDQNLDTPLGSQLTPL